MMNKKGFSFLFLISLLFTSIFASNNYSPKVVRVGYYSKEGFQEGAKEGDAKKGYAYEYYRKLSEYTGWKYEYIYGSYDELLQKTADGKVDLIAGITNPEENQKVVDFPELPMGKINFSLLKQNDSVSINTNPSSLNGKTIGVLGGILEQVLNTWLKENKVNARVQVFNSVFKMNSAFEAKTVDVIFVENASSYKSQECDVFLIIDKADFYLGVNKSRPDLLAELNEAQRQLINEDPEFITSLSHKYFQRSMSPRAFSEIELEWIERHKEVHVGYLKHYLPYCDSGLDGNLYGMLRDIMPEILRQLGLESKISVLYTSYDSTADMIEALNNGRLDLIFPVGGGLFYSEENGIYQSTAVVNTSVSLVFNKKYVYKEAPIFAVNKNNRMQEYYIRTNFPTSKVLYFDSIDDSLKAIVDGKADCTTINGLRVNSLLKNSKYRNLGSVPLPQNDERCFGVSIGNEGLLKLVNRALNSIDNYFILDLSYLYTDGLYKYTSLDFIRDFFFVFIGVFFLVGILIVGFLLRDKYKTKVFLNREKLKNEELQMSHHEQETQLEEIKQLNLELEKAFKNTEKYVADMMRYASSADDPNIILENILKYIGENTKSNRAFIYEINPDNTIDNTYEWCGKNEKSYKDQLQGFKLDTYGNEWFKQFEKLKNIVVSDLKEIKTSNPTAYEFLKSNGVKSLVLGPIVIDGNISGFYGVLNPPKNSVYYISDFFDLVEFVFSLMIRIRNNTRALEQSAILDQLTGCKNRKALVKDREELFDPEKSLSLVAIDMNGLKKINDNQGHEAGDHFICRIADTLSEVFGKDHIYRMGGDEFTAVLNGLTKQQFEDLLQLCKLQIGNTASIGTYYTERMSDFEFSELLKRADQAMYKDKDAFYQHMRKNP